MNEEILEAYKESCKQAEKIIVSQTEQIASLHLEISLHKQRILCQEKIIKGLEQKE